VNIWSIIDRHSAITTTCVLCGRRDPHSGYTGLCLDCHGELPAIRRPCHRCGLPLPDAPRIGVCGRCQANPPPYGRCVAPLAYTPPVPQLIGGLKYGHRLHYARVLGELLAVHLAHRHAPLPELILPVPLHAGRIRERGFNQALEIALAAGKRLRIRVDRTRLRRTRPTLPQTGLDRRSRLQNLKEAFELGDGPAASHVAVLDDVVTTGATVGTIAKVLHRAGIPEVSVWAIARTPT